MCDCRCECASRMDRLADRIVDAVDEGLKRHQLEVRIDKRQVARIVRDGEMSLRHRHG